MTPEAQEFWDNCTPEQKATIDGIVDDLAQELSTRLNAWIQPKLSESVSERHQTQGTVNGEKPCTDAANPSESA